MRGLGRTWGQGWGHDMCPGCGAWLVSCLLSGLGPALGAVLVTWPGAISNAGLGPIVGHGLCEGLGHRWGQWWGSGFWGQGWGYVLGHGLLACLWSGLLPLMGSGLGAGLGIVSGVSPNNMAVVRCGQGWGQVLCQGLVHRGGQG